MTSGSTRVFAGFDAGNPQHLAWLKRKLARQARYERHYRHGTRGARKPRHMQSRRPEPLLLKPLGRDSATLEWQRIARIVCFPRPIPHPQYRRHPITGRIT